MTHIGEKLGVEPSKVLLQSRRHFLWTPKGLVDLAEPSDFRDFKPCLLGTFYTPGREGTELDEIEDRPPRLLEDRLRCPHVDKMGVAVPNSSHDLDPVLG